MRYFFIQLTLLLFVISCAEKQEINKYIIPEDQFIEILSDFHIVDAAAKQGVIANNRNTRIKHTQYKGILEHYNIERERFDSTIHYYSRNPKAYKILYEKVETRLTNKIKVNQEE